MSAPHLAERWIEANGDLAVEPRTELSVQDDLIGDWRNSLEFSDPGE